MKDKKALRNQLRNKRRNLNNIQQQKAAKAIANIIASSLPFQRAKSIALYSANDGEISLSVIHKLANKHRKACFFPVINKKSMEFRLLTPKLKLTLKNKFGIAEPNARAPKIEARQLDLVLLPLVGFDLFGNRLGMGGGFYDRAFAFRSKVFRKPVLMGTAHHCQKIQKLIPDSWDITLDYIVTDEEQIKI